MRKSRAITLAVLAGWTLTGCCITSLGCGKRGSSTGPRYEPPDHTWYDADGNKITEKWKTDEQGNRVLDEQGRPIPEPGVPYDRLHRPWVHTNGVWSPLPILIAHSLSSGSRSSSWFSGGSGYRTSGTTTTYRSGTGSGSTSIGSSSAAPSGSSISRGGFGSTGSSSSSSSSS